MNYLKLCVNIRIRRGLHREEHGGPGSSLAQKGL